MSLEALNLTGTPLVGDVHFLTIRAFVGVGEHEMEVTKIDEMMAAKDVGQNRLEYAHVLMNWLYGSTKSQLTYRIAPSVICRGEICLLSLSSPRFACRVYHDSDRALGFANLRRISTLARQDLAWGDFHENSISTEPPSNIIAQDQSVIADSLFSAPDFTRDFQIAFARLNDAYAEPAFDGSSFVQCMRLSGGLCAQAAIWMCVSALTDLTDALHSMAEISFIANYRDRDPNEANSVPVGGMSFWQTGVYLSSIGLRGPTHFLQPNGHTAQKLATGMRPYIRSGFPIIAAVDLLRLTGTAQPNSCIYEKNLYNDNPTPIPRVLRPKCHLQVQHHAIVLVGTHNSEKDRFLAHDPASVPFIQITAQDLVERRNYKNLQEGGQDNLLDGNLADQIRYQPVVPAAVKLFLELNAEAAGSIRFGLRWLYESLYRDIAFWQGKGIHFSLPSNFDETELWLLDLTPSERVGAARAEDVLADVGLSHNDLIRFSEAAKWIWLQRIPPDEAGKSFVLVWDASTKLPDFSSSKYNLPSSSSESIGSQALIGHVEITDSNQVSIETKAPTNIQNEACLPPELGKNLRRSIITSAFPVNAIAGCEEVRRRLIADGVLDDGQILPIELYVAMESDIGSLAEAAGVSPQSVSAVEVLAKSIENVDGLRSWAQALSDRLETARLSVVGLASFIPEISSISKNSPRLRVGSHALIALQIIAAELRKNAVHPADFIEIVGGSRFDGLQIVKGDPITRDMFGAGYFDMRASVMSIEQVIQNIGSAANNCFSWLNMSNLRDWCQFAVEIEEGPAFALNSIDAWDAVATAWPSEFQDYFGLNVDLSHVEQIGDMNRLAARNDLIPKIANLHVSGHAKFHVGDTHFDGFSSSAVQFLTSLLSKRSDLNISLEFEAAPNAGAVADSARKLFEL